MEAGCGTAFVEQCKIAFQFTPTRDQEIGPSLVPGFFEFNKT